MARIFISYCRADRSLVTRLLPTLQKVFQQHTIWHDARLTGGERWWATILREIEACDLLVYLISNASLEVDYCQAEVREATRLHKPVLPIIVSRLNPSRTTERLRETLLDTQFLNFASDLQRTSFSIARLAGAITSQLNQLPEQREEVTNPIPTPTPNVNDKVAWWKRTITKEVAVVVGVIALVLGASLISKRSSQIANPLMPTTAGPYPTLDETQTPTQWQPIVHTFDYNGYAVQMVLVPAGSFLMGTDDQKEDERPAHIQQIEEPFWLDLYEVTNEQFNTLGGEAAEQGKWDDPQKPRETVNWEEAQDFCIQRRAGFLPSEAQWEWAARGPQHLIYPWGNEFDPTKSVWDTDVDDGPANVGSIMEGKSWIGALDMSGNLSEWTSSIYQPYPYDAYDGREDQDNRSGWRVRRGGSWFHFFIFDNRSATRDSGSIAYTDNEVGFRCARSFDGE